MKREDGFSLVEVVIAIAVLAIVAATIVTYFAWSFRVFGYVDVKATAESLARSELEAIKSLAYSESVPTYTTGLTHPADYDVTNTVTNNVTGILGLQKITVTVTRTYFEGPGEERTETLVIEGYKLDR